MGIVVDGADGATWSITPGRDEVELALTVRRRRFVASVPVAEMPAVEQVMAGMPHPSPGETVDVSAQFMRALGRDPFAEQPVDGRPCYRRLVSPKRPG
ncbi:hypothetical protein COUCH_19900 [Couchioplanes caeruleus]|uniref:hypothetical protein n=1 Tax=Couchioplanes caeruleus TaxID=56438 RepID=UPI0020BF67F4|nr:hypothetical protein [Couchioplanes caeruleus]UQU61328.1 hypothetical protein COUCH_19900 [Couchioplanes caeruleus]